MRVLFRSLRHEWDPLDLEILEKAFDATWDAVEGNDLVVDFDSDEGSRSHPPTRADRDCLFQWRERPRNPPRHPVDSFAAGQTSTVNTSPSVVLPAGVGDRERGDNDLKIFECGNARTTLARHIRG